MVIKMVKVKDRYMVDTFICYRIKRTLLMKTYNMDRYAEIEPDKYIVVNTWNTIKPETIYPHFITQIQDEKIPLLVHSDVKEIINALEPEYLLITLREVRTKIPKTRAVVFPNIESIKKYFEMRLLGHLIIIDIRNTVYSELIKEVLNTYYFQIMPLGVKHDQDRDT